MVASRKWPKVGSRNLQTEAFGSGDPSADGSEPLERSRDPLPDGSGLVVHGPKGKAHRSRPGEEQDEPMGLGLRLASNDVAR